MFSKALSNPDSSLATHYGAVIGLAELGHHVSSGHHVDSCSNFIINSVKFRHVGFAKYQLQMSVCETERQIKS